MFENHPVWERVSHMWPFTNDNGVRDYGAKLRIRGDRWEGISSKGETRSGTVDGSEFRVNLDNGALTLRIYRVESSAMDALAEGLE